MRKIIALIIVLLFNKTNFCFAQIYIEPIVGYQYDVNNNFTLLNTSMQLTFKKNKHYEFNVQLQNSWGVKRTLTDSSFSTNPNMPIYAGAKKTIKPSIASFLLSNRFPIIGKNKPNTFALLVNGGVSYQNIVVAYFYDKNNYTILNPDKTLSKIGVILGAGAEYMHTFKKGRVFFQLHISSTPNWRKINYPNSFNYIVPLTFNTGYSIEIKNKK